MAEELEKKKAAPEKEGAVTDEEAETAVGGFKPTNIPNWQRTTDTVKNGNDNNR